MNTLRWTIYKAADSQGKVIDRPTLDQLRKLHLEGYRWANRGFGIESAMDIIMDLDMSEDLKHDLRRLRAVKSDESLLDDFNYTNAESDQDELNVVSLQKSLKKFLDKN